jgi:predicted secreted protein
MSILDAAFIYFLLWWVTLFTVLPMGVKRNTDVEQGHDAGAPVFPDLKKKLIINSIVAGVLVAILWALVYFGVIRWGDWFRNAIPVPR